MFVLPIWISSLEYCFPNLTISVFLSFTAFMSCIHDCILDMANVCFFKSIPSYFSQLIEELSDIDSDDDLITFSQLSVSDNDSIEYQPPTPAESRGTHTFSFNTIIPPTVPNISNLSLKINKAVNVRPIDSI